MARSKGMATKEPDDLNGPEFFMAQQDNAVQTHKLGERDLSFVILAQRGSMDCRLGDVDSRYARVTKMEDMDSRYARVTVTGGGSDDGRGGSDLKSPRHPREAGIHLVVNEMS